MMTGTGRSLAMCCLVILIKVAANSVSGNCFTKLPREVIPLMYDIRILPFFEEGGRKKFTFDGQVSIVTQAEKSKKTITLHATSMTFLKHPVVKDAFGKIINVVSYKLDDDRERVVLHLAHRLVPGDLYSITIMYSANMSLVKEGFFRDYYHDGKHKRWFGATQLEPIYARKVFPCFDEPDLRAVFQVTIARLPHMNVVSNMPLERTYGPDKRVGGRYWDRFQISISMPVYLVSFLVSDFKSIHYGNYSIWARKPAINNTINALRLTPLVVYMMENITGVPYTLPKLDSMILPYFSGGMENWGLILYGEELLTLEAKSNYFRRVSAPLITHEISHQWFGNLVTMKCWKYLWLNEAFATLFENVVLHLLFPDWRMYELMVLKNQFPLMEYDSNPSVLPIVHNVDERDVSTLFNPLTYKKGASILKMVEKVVTPSTFLKGVGYYIRANMHTSVEEDDFYSALQYAIDEDRTMPETVRVKAMMRSWFHQAGLPLVTVLRNYKTGTAQLTQARFMYHRKGRSTRWYIPVSYTTATELNFFDRRPKLWMVPNEKNVTIYNLPDETQWILMNVQSTGYFRVNYDVNNWMLLAWQLVEVDHTVIPPINRAQLLEDAFHFVRSGHMNISFCVKLFSYLQFETDSIPWLRAFTHLGKLDDLLSGSKDFHIFQTFATRLMRKVFGFVKFSKEHEYQDLIDILRPQVYYWSCTLLDKSCLKLAYSVFSKNSSSINDRKLVYCASVRLKGNCVWNKLWRRFRNVPNVSHRRDILSALGCTDDERLLSRLLDFTVENQSQLKPEEKKYVFTALCSGRNRHGCTLALDFLMHHAYDLANKLGGHDIIVEILHGMAFGIRTTNQLTLMKQINQKYLNRHFDVRDAASNVIKRAEKKVTGVKTIGKLVIDAISKLSHY